MSSAKAAVAVCVAAALSLSACGVAAKPEAGTARADAISAHNLTKSDPRTKHVKCLAQHHIAYTELSIGGDPSIQVGSLPGGPTAVFLQTPGAAQDAQITGRAQSAEVIGAALLYPHAGSNRLLAIVESCMAKGVTG